MRLVLALCLAAAGVLAAVPPVAGDACLPSCDVPSHTLAFVPPVTHVPSGAVVTWHALDTVHTATDRLGFCFHADFNLGQPGRASFLVSDGKLFAAAAGDAFAECDAATAMPDGSFVLDYVCLLHPNMRAKLVVR